MVYEPREDSFLLEEAVKKYAKARVLDIGTGTGIQAQAALTRTNDVTACDVDPEALELAKSRSEGINFIQSDLFSNIDGKFDTIIFNPPYLPTKEPRDKALDGGERGRELLDQFLEQAKAYLTERGQLLFVQSSITGNEATKQKLIELGYNWEIISTKRIFFEELMVFRAWVQPKE